MWHLWNFKTPHEIHFTNWSYLHILLNISFNFSKKKSIIIKNVFFYCNYNQVLSPYLLFSYFINTLKINYLFICFRNLESTLSKKHTKIFLSYCFVLECSNSILIDSFAIFSPESFIFWLFFLLCLPGFGDSSASNNLNRFHCPQCWQSYTRMDNLKRHLRLECGKPATFACPLCPKKFKRHNHMTSHSQLLHNIFIPGLRRGPINTQPYFNWK